MACETDFKKLKAYIRDRNYAHSMLFIYSVWAFNENTAVFMVSCLSTHQ